MPATTSLLRVGRRCPLGASLAYFLIPLLMFPAGCGKDAPAPPPPMEVPVVEVVQQDVPVTGEFVGEIEGEADIDIRARVQGFLLGIHFKEGSEVKKGELLYTIDQLPYQAKVNETEGRLAESQSNLTNAKTDLERIRPLAEIKAVSQRDLDAAEARYGAAQGQFAAAQAALELARIELGYCNISSPEDGVIGLSLARVGDFVGLSPNPVVLNTVSSLGNVRVRFSINERDYLTLARRFQADKARGDLPQQDLALILADGSEYPHPGRVNVVNREVDAQTGGITIEAFFPNPEGLLRPGQFGRVRAVMETRSDAVVVPQRAIIELQGSFRAFVVGEGDTAQVRALTLGPKVGDLRIVEKGLSPGDRVVYEGAMRLRPGMVVIPKVVTPGAADASASGTKKPAESGSH